MTDKAASAGLPTPKDRGLTVPADPPTGLAAAGMVPAAGLPAPKHRGLTMPAALPTDLAAAGMVPAAGLPADMPQGKALPMDMPSNLRNAHPAEHIGVVLAALRSLGLTHKVPSQVIRSLYPSLMVQTGIQPMATNTFCRHLAEVCERSRPRVGEIEGAASKTRAKVVVYTLPCDGVVKVGKKPPAGAVKTARARTPGRCHAYNLRGHRALSPKARTMPRTPGRWNGDLSWATLGHHAHRGADYAPGPSHKAPWHRVIG
jgi:hypothetical protein